MGELGPRAEGRSDRRVRVPEEALARGLNFFNVPFFPGYGQDLFWPQTHAVQLPDVSAAPACPHRERHSDQGGCGRAPSVAPTRKCQSSVGLRLKDGCQLTGRHLDEELPEAPGGLSQEVISPVYEHIEGASVKGIVFDREATWPVF